VVLISLKKDKTLIIHMGRAFDESVREWMLREKTLLVDENHVMFRDLATKVLLNILKQYVGDNVSFRSYMVQEFAEAFRNLTKDVLEFMG